MGIRRKKSRAEKRDEKEQRILKSKGTLSVVILEDGLKRHGSGNNINLVPVSERRKKKSGLF